jgi:hypothetical protein
MPPPANLQQCLAAQLELLACSRMCMGDDSPEMLRRCLNEFQASLAAAAALAR